MATVEACWHEIISLTLKLTGFNYFHRSQVYFNNPKLGDGESNRGWLIVGYR